MKLMKKNGATATDDRDGDLTSKIKTTGKVDTKKEGTYIITYTVEDSAKNSASVTRIVIVKGNSSSGGNNTGDNTGNNTVDNEIGNNTTGEGNNTANNTNT